MKGHGRTYWDRARSLTAWGGDVTRGAVEQWRCRPRVMLKAWRAKVEPQVAGEMGLADQGGDGVSEDNGRPRWSQRDEGALVESKGWGSPAGARGMWEPWRSLRGGKPWRNRGSVEPRWSPELGGLRWVWGIHSWWLGRQICTTLSWGNEGRWGRGLDDFKNGGGRLRRLEVGRWRLGAG